MQHGTACGPSERHRMRLSAAAVCTWALACVGLALAASPAGADPCSNEAARVQEGLAMRLPDCRAFEQVTPVNKDATNPSGGDSLVQVARSGDAVTFFAEANLPGGHGASEFPLFVALRGATAWSAQGLDPPSPPGPAVEVLGWSEDLTMSAALGFEPTDGLYLHDVASNSFQLAVPGLANYFVDGFSADDSSFIFETEEQLLPAAVAGKTNLYEWRDGTVSLVGLLPEAEGGEAPPTGSFAASYDWTDGITSTGGGTARYYTQGAISEDGAEVFFTAGDGQLYVRQNGRETLHVSASHRASPDPNGEKPAAFLGAAPDGSVVYFMTCEKLTDDSTAVSTPTGTCREPGEGEDLYRYDVATRVLTDLSVDRTAGDAAGAGVQGLLGAGGDPPNAFVYFAANGVLAPGASHGNCQGLDLPEFTSECSVYVFHEGDIKFVARLHSGSGQVQDFTNWSPEPNRNGQNVPKTARVSADGRVLLFTSAQQLTGFNNEGFNEVFRYEGEAENSSQNPACISCGAASSEAAPAGNAALRSISTSVSIATESKLTRNLAANGDRIFFETPDALVPSDTNGTQDVYEWEVATGSICQAGGTFVVASRGCLYLLSTGTSPDPSYFADASVSGDDAMIFTDQPLVGQDKDELVDIYDARVGGGLGSQNPPGQPSCTAEACREASPEPPAFSTPASAQLSGDGNVAPAAPVKPVAVRHLTRAQQLAKALAACRHLARPRRAKCRRRAQRKYRAQVEKKSQRRHR